jgi:hypothetical protein
MSRFDVAKYLATYGVGRAQHWYIATAGLDRRSFSCLTVFEVVYYDLRKAME